MCSVLTEDLLSFIELIGIDNGMRSVKLQHQYLFLSSLSLLHSNF